MALTATTLVNQSEYTARKSQSQNEVTQKADTRTEATKSTILSTKDISTAGIQLVNFYTSNKYSFCPFINPANTVGPLESYTRVFIQDLVGEGPLFGLVDDLGNDLVLFDNGQDNEENLKGVYFNDVAIKNSVTNSLNFSNVQVYGKIGTEFQSAINNTEAANNLFSPWSMVGVTYEYGKTLYGLIVNENTVLNEDDKGVSNKLAHTTYLSSYKNGVQVDYYTNSTLKGKDKALNRNAFNDSVFQECFGICHEIKDQNTDYLILTFKINSMYSTDGGGSTISNFIDIGMQLGFKYDPSVNYGIYHKISGIVTGPYQFSIVLNVKDFPDYAVPFVKVYNFTNAVKPDDTKSAKNIQLLSVTEIIDKNFKYPNSAYYTLGLDGRAFSNVPTRSYNLKLLQIKVPENYDADAKTYDGFWSGEFDPTLRWSDNPAWILYDLLTNYRYGVGKFDLSNSIVDKWSMYEIAKYCDELVPTFNNTKYPALTVSQIAPNSFGKNWILLSGQGITEEYFQKGQLLSFYNLKFNLVNDLGEAEVISRCFNKRIKNFQISVDKTSAAIELYNDFGLHKICARFPEVKNYLLTLSTVKTLNQALTALNNVILNNNSNTTLTNFVNYILSQAIFTEEEIENYVASSGLAAQKFPGYFPIVEPRFTANLILTSETDVINLVNNMSSIFKGLVYWSNNFLNFDNDRPKASSYFFNNSNVRDGIFTYSGTSKDTRFTVVKLIYADEADGFKDKTVYIEDQINIRKYGYVEKELIGFGVTSRSQAKRLGEWFLVTNQIEQDLVTFKAGPEIMLLNPGDIISISDSLKLTKRYGGRVVSINNANEITLDSRYDFIKVNDSLSFIVPAVSKTVNDLNVKSEKELISDSEIKSLSSTYIYTYKVLSVGLDGNFRTKVVLKTTNTEDDTKAEENFYSISPSTLWIYEKSATNTDTSFVQQFRIVGIKEENPVEFTVTAAEYIKSKFNYIDNKYDLSNKTIYSSVSDNQLINQPINILANLTSEQIQGDNGVISRDKQTFTFDQNYDYIMNGLDLTDAAVNTLFSVITINVNQILKYAGSSDTLKGLLIEYVLNSKKITIKFTLGDSKTFYKIVTPNLETSSSCEFIRAYKLGVNDTLI